MTRAMGFDAGQVGRFMQLAVDEADRAMRAHEGGPFGACVVKDGAVLAVAGNSVLRDRDPTAHAEMNAIRAAAKKVDHWWLEGCVLFSTCEPCPMCLAAAYWARIREVYFGCRMRDADACGFADVTIREALGKDMGGQDMVFHPDTHVAACRALMAGYQAVPDRQGY